METGNNLALTLGKVEGDTVCLGKGRDDEDNRSEGLQHNAPHGYKAEEQFSLELDDFRQIDSTVDHEQADQCEPHGDFIADHLGGRAKTTEHAVLVV